MTLSNPLNPLIAVAAEDNAIGFLQYEHLSVVGHPPTSMIICILRSLVEEIDQGSSISPPSVLLRDLQAQLRGGHGNMTR